MQTLFLLIAICGSYVAGESCYDYYSNSDCYNTDVKDSYIYCYGYKSCYGSLLEATNTMQCGGSYGCYYADGIESSSGSIYCDGDYACAYSQGEIEAWNGNVYCDGNSGCFNVQADIQGNDVYCTGDYGCFSTDGNITAKDDVYCDGNYGCYYVTGTISGEDVYVRGLSGARLTTIEAKTDVSCSNQYSCYSADITAGDDVYFTATYSGYYATVTAKDVQCSGQYSCYRSTLDVESTVTVYGRNGAYYSTITAKDLNVYGYYGAFYSDVTSPETGALTIKLYGYRSGYLMDVYCLSGVTCNINCYSNQACRSTKVYYYGSLSNVNIYPNDCKDNAGSTNDDNVYCPYLYSSSSTSLEEFQSHSKAERRKDPQFEEFEKEIAEDLEKMEAKKKRDDAERAKREDSIIDDVYFNVEGIVSNVGVKRLDNSIYGSIIGGIVTFTLLYCYYSNKYKDLKYESLS